MSTTDTLPPETPAEAKSGGGVVLTKKLAAAKKLTSELRKQLATLTRDASADEARNNLRIAKRKAKFRVGDIIEYTESHHPIVVTEIVAYYGKAYPAYHGYEVANGRLTMNKRGTEGWGTQEESSRIGYSWKKVGHARDLRRATPNDRSQRRSEPPLASANKTTGNGSLRSLD